LKINERHGPATYQDMRNLVAQHIPSLWSKRAFGGLTLAEVEHNRTSEAFSRFVQTTGYGGSTEAVIISRILNIEIHIYTQVDESDSAFAIQKTSRISLVCANHGKLVTKSHRVLHLLYLRRKEHYNLLLESNQLHCYINLCK
jgi:hypothetical protein